jgi:ribosome-associated protein
MAEKRKKTAANSRAKTNGAAAGKPKVAKAAGKPAARPAPKPVKRAGTKKSAARPAAKVSRAADKRPASKQSASKQPAKKKPAAAPAATSNESHAKAVLKVIEHSLEELKAANVRVLDVRNLTDIADMLVIASGNSDRHVRSIADRVVQDAKKAGFRPVGVEGERDGEWVLVDLQDIIVHIMLPRIREFYRLENLWDVSAARREAAELAAAAEG